MTLYITTRIQHMRDGHVKVSPLSAASSSAEETMGKDFIQFITEMDRFHFSMSPEALLREVKEKGVYRESNVAVIRYKKEDDVSTIEVDEVLASGELEPCMAWSVHPCNEVVLSEQAMTNIACDADYAYMEGRVVARLEQIQAEEVDYPTRKDIDFHSEEARELVDNITSAAYKDTYRYG